MYNNTKQQIRLIQAAPGRGKTHYICHFIKNRLHQQRLIVALRTRDCADEFERDLREILIDNDQQFVKKVYADRDEQDSPTSVTFKLDAALRDSESKVIIICQKALDTYPKWYLAKEFVLFIDELFDSLYFYTFPLPLWMAEGLGISESKHAITIDELNSRAEKAFEQSNDNPHLSEELKSLIDNLRGACCVHIKRYKGGYKLALIRESNIYKILSVFNTVYLAGMIIERTLPYLISIAKGVEFTKADWERQGERFVTDDKVTLIPLMRRDVSQTFLNSPPDAKVKNFETLFKRAIQILDGCGIPEKIYYMVNREIKGRDRKSVIERSFSNEGIVDMGISTHGKHNWKDERKFALLYVHQWKPDFTEVGKEYARKLGVKFEELTDAYKVSMQYEPIAQAATRGQVRKDGTKASWIVVLDMRTAEYLQKTIMHKCLIDTSLIADVGSKSLLLTTRSNAGVKSLMKSEFGLSDTQAKRVERYCKQEGIVDRENPEHLEGARNLVKRLYPDLATERLLS